MEVYSFPFLKKKKKKKKKKILRAFLGGRSIYEKNKVNDGEKDN